MEIRRKATKPSPEAAIWSLAYVDVAAKEGKRILDETQYAHALQQIEELARADDPRRPATLDVKSIERFFELRDKGGVLGRINLRVYFAVLDDSHTIIVLGCYKKEDEGQLPTRIKVRIRNRLRFILENI